MVKSSATGWRFLTPTPMVLRTGFPTFGLEGPLAGFRSGYIRVNMLSVMVSGEPRGEAGELALRAMFLSDGWPYLELDLTRYPEPWAEFSDGLM